MDPITGIGIVLAIVAVLVTAILEGLHLSSLWVPSSFVLIAFGTTGVTLACFTLGQIISAMKQMGRLVKKPGMNLVEVIEAIAEISMMAKREGLLVLEKYKPKIQHPVLNQGIALMIDGTNPELVKQMMEITVSRTEEEIKVPAAVFAAAGGFAPTLGIIGTVMGLVHVLGNLSDPNSLGPAIAAAFIATLYGIASANILFLPMSKKFGVIAKEETLVSEMIIEGVLSIYAGESPTIVRQKLMSFVLEHGPKKEEAKK